MSKNGKNCRQAHSPEPDEARTDLINQALREDFIFEAKDRAKVGKPRKLAIAGNDEAFVRIAAFNERQHAKRRIAENRKDGTAVISVINGLAEIKSLDGPKTDHAVDKMVADLFAEAANLGPALEAIRQSAQVHIHRGANWLQFKPIIVQSGPGAGKTRIVSRLSELSGLPLIYVDCAATSNTTPLVSQDSSWANSRHSDIIDGLARSGSGNPIVCLDELDKMRALSRHDGPTPSELLVGMLERSSAKKHMDNFLQLQVDLTFINWVILVNDLERLSKPLVDRCQVIRLAAPTPSEIASIAAREIERRGLEPEIVGPIIRATKAGKLTSMRQLHRLLDRAAAASSRPRFH